jgi:hypothetical protein
MSKKLIPSSVLMVQRGFVYNPNARFMTSPWVNAVEMMEKQAAEQLEIKIREFKKRVRVNKTVDVLGRFVATWVAQSRTARSAWNSRKAGEMWRNAALSPNWFDMMEEEANRIADERAEAEAQFEARLMAMSDAEIIRYHQQTMMEHRRHREDYRPWMDFIAKIQRKRAALRSALSESEQMWVELNVRPALHNQQRPAQVRRVVSRGGFSALDDSDSE